MKNAITIVGYDKTGFLPIIEMSEEYKEYLKRCEAVRKPYRGPLPTAEDLDRKCTEVQQARELDEKFGEIK